jgi:peroxiredoxin
MSNRNIPLPQEQAPELSFQLTSGEQWLLDDQDPDSFTMIVFYRGLHCPVCKGYTKTLEKLKDKYADRGVDIVTVSMDSEERALKSIQDWGIKHLDVGYGLSEVQARNWGL